MSCLWHKGPKFTRENSLSTMDPDTHMHTHTRTHMHARAHRTNSSWVCRPGPIPEKTESTRWTLATALAVAVPSQPILQDM